MPDPAPPEIDPTVPQDGNRHGTDGHYSGQEADASGRPVPTRVHSGALAGGSRADAPPAAGADAGDPAIPPEAGRRATVDPATGAVHGSGAGAGGGQAGEDPDDDAGGSNTAR